VTRRFVDTNIFLRFLLDDHPRKTEAIDGLFARAEAGEFTLVTTELALAEIVWVLETSYEQGREAIAAMIEALLAQPGIEVLGGELAAAALETYRTTRLDFVDAWLLARMAEQGFTDIYSYDRKHLSGIPGVTRLEP